MTTIDPSEFSPPGAREAPGGRIAAQSAHVFFDRRELQTILNLYGQMVIAGEWRDYAISSGREGCYFAVYRRASEMPLYLIEKRPKLARRQGAYAIISASGHILKRGQELAQVLKFFDKKRFRIIE